MRMYIVTLVIGLMLVGCRNSVPEGLYKFYDGDHIGDFLHFEPQRHYLENDTIFLGHEPIGLLIFSEFRLITGDRFISVKEIGSNRQATYIGK